MKYKIVFEVNGRTTSLLFSDRRSLIMYASEMEWTPEGIERGAHLRKEIRGEPTYKELSGPMYDGPGRVRYETR